MPRATSKWRPCRRAATASRRRTTKCTCLRRATTAPCGTFGTLPTTPYCKLPRSTSDPAPPPPPHCIVFSIRISSSVSPTTNPSPSSYLHHANVDRLFALWQAIYPNQSSFAGSYTNEGQFATPPAENVSSSSPLRPFYDGARNFWTADSVADTRVLGYAYPETADAWNLTAAQLAAAVAGRVNALYAPPPPSPSPSSAGAASVVGPGGSSAAGSDYALAVTVDRAELPLPCRVVLHLAGAGPDPVGRVALLALPRGGVARAELPLLRVVVGRGGGRGSVEGPAKGVLDGDGGDGDVGKEDGGGGVGGKAGWEDAIGAGGAAVARLLQKGLRAEIVMVRNPLDTVLVFRGFGGREATADFVANS